MNRHRSKVTVVGAGIVGVACAEAFAREGFDVVVVDSGMIGGEATAQGMGHIVLMDDSQAQLALTAYSQQLWHELLPSLPSNCEAQTCGTIWVAADNDEMHEVHRKHAIARDHGVPTHVLDASTLGKVEPWLRPGLAGGLMVSRDSAVYTPAVAAWLMAQAAEYGATLRKATQVVEIDDGGVVIADGTRIESDIVVSAAGIWSSYLSPGIAVRPRKGHLLVTDYYPGLLHHQLIELGYLKSAHASTEDSVAFNVQPRTTGQLLIGSSRQFGDETAEVNLFILSRMVRRAIDYVPILAQLLAIRSWTGFRAATPDNLPLIGPSPRHDWLYLATGHEGLGTTTSLGTARLLVDYVLGRETAIPIVPYLPARFERGASRG